MKTGKLNKQEEYIIKGMYADGKPTAEIAAFLDRTEKAIAKVVDGLKSAAEEAPKVVEQADEDDAEISVPSGPTASTIAKAIKKIVQRIGCSEKKAAELVRVAINKWGHKLLDDSGQLAETAINQQYNAKALMNTKTSGKKNKGVAIMTAEASDRVDKHREYAEKTKRSRTARGCIFNMETGEIE